LVSLVTVPVAIAVFGLAVGLVAGFAVGVGWILSLVLEPGDPGIVLCSGALFLVGSLLATVPAVFVANKVRDKISGKD